MLAHAKQTWHCMSTLLIESLVHILTIVLSSTSASIRFTTSLLEEILRAKNKIQINILVYSVLSRHVTTKLPKQALNLLSILVDKAVLIVWLPFPNLLFFIVKALFAINSALSRFMPKLLPCIRQNLIFCFVLDYC